MSDEKPAVEERKPTMVNELGLNSLANSYLAAVKRRKEALEASNKATEALKQADAGLEAIKADLVDQAELRNRSLNIVILDGQGIIRVGVPDKGYSRATRINRVEVEELTSIENAEKRRPKK